MINHGEESVGKSNLKIHMEKIRKGIDITGKRALEINIEYPQIENDDCKVTLERINAFYGKMAENYSGYCENVLTRNIDKSFSDTENRNPFGEVMKCFVPYHDDIYISVLLEITHFNGYFKNTKRVCHTWDYINGTLLDKGYFLKKANKSKRNIKKLVGDMIISSIQNGNADFSYTENNLKRYAYRVNPNNFFLCKKGIAFWFDIGTIAPESEGFPTFVVPVNIKENELSENSSK